MHVSHCQSRPFFRVAVDLECYCDNVKIMSDDTTKKQRGHILACSVFKPALDVLLQDDFFSGITLSYIPSHLHLYPDALKQSLLETLGTLEPRNIPVILVYGSCFPGIDTFCREHKIQRIRGEHCYEIMLGGARFQEIMHETAGTYFLEQDLVRNFQEYCIEPLELYDEEMRRLCLGHYKRLLYLQQPNDPDLEEEIERVSRFLNFPSSTLHVDYIHLKNRLLAALAGSRNNST